jgi:hypothetical protein
MTVLEQIQQRLEQLPPEKQSEVLDFVTFLGQRLSTKLESLPEKRSLQAHPAFGSWKTRTLDALEYEQTLRREWDSRP